MQWEEAYELGLVLMGEAEKLTTSGRKKEAAESLAQAQRHLESVVGNAAVGIDERAKVEKVLLKVYEKQGLDEIESVELLEKKRKLTHKKCFIATAACGSEMAPEVLILREFRDTHLSRFPIGRGAVSLYNLISPPLAAFIERSRFLQSCVRRVLIVPAVALAKIIIRQYPRS
ncbi:MAG: CFI-box-CTERM domain-containing protein [bacterium]